MFNKAISFLKHQIEKVNVQVSVLTCCLILFSCCITYFATSGSMLAMLTNAYDERANLTFNTIESHLDKRLFEDEEMQEGAFSASMGYLSVITENMAVSDICIYRKDSDDNVICVLDTKNAKTSNGQKNEVVSEKIEKYVNKMYKKNHASKGELIFTKDGCKYMNFYPVSNDGRNVKGIVGVSINAGQLHALRIIMRILLGIIILICCFISIRFSNRIFRKISNPLYMDASNTDVLTGLKNKNSFTVDVHNLEKGNVERYSVINIDLNGLKGVNDTRGHQEGDAYIRKAADILRKAKEGDTRFVGYRVGGDEFTVIVRDAETDELKAFADRVDKLTEESNKMGGMTLAMSIGYAKFDRRKDRNFSMTIERSDAMMYENKRKYYRENNLKPR